jgi:hypothetical protein
MGKDARFVSTKFSDIIDHLLDKKCDAIISLMNDTSQRRTEVRFVDYLAAGQHLMVKKGTTPINSLAELCGRSVSVASGTTEEDFLKAANEAAPGGKRIVTKSYPSENNAILALDNGKVEAYFGDAPVVQGAVAADSSLVRGAELVKPIPVGIRCVPAIHGWPQCRRRSTTCTPTGRWAASCRSGSSPATRSRHRQRLGKLADDDANLVLHLDRDDHLVTGSSSIGSIAVLAAARWVAVTAGTASPEESHITPVTSPQSRPPRRGGGR